MRLKFAAQASVIIVGGNSGSGKSSYVVKYLLNAGFQCRFIFDPRGEYATRFHRPACRTRAELIAAVQTGWVIFDPTLLYPGNSQKALEDFSEWAWHVAGNLAGRSAIFIDEIWKHCSPNKIPLPIAMTAQDGRKNGITLICSTQRPNRINEAIWNECNQLVCFRLRGRKAIDIVKEYDDEFPVEQLRTLPPMHFIARNLDSGGERRGVVKL